MENKAIDVFIVELLPKWSIEMPAITLPIELGNKKILAAKKDKKKDY